MSHLYSENGQYPAAQWSSIPMVQLRNELKTAALLYNCILLTKLFIKTFFISYSYIHIFQFYANQTILVRKLMFHSIPYNKILSKLLFKFIAKPWISLIKYELYMIGKVESFKCCKGLIGKLYFTPHWALK